MRHKIVCAAGALLSAMMLSCAGGDKEVYEYVPVKASGANNWSIMKIGNGKIVCKDEFKNRPSVVCEDVFYVANENGTYDYYNVDNVKKPINGEPFVGACQFSGYGVTPAVRKNETISLINTDCEVVKTLDKSIVKCSKFVEGLAVVEMSDGKKGYIDTKGEIVVKAEYTVAERPQDGVVICGKETEGGKTMYDVMETDGSLLFSFSSETYPKFGLFNDGYMTAQSGDDMVLIDKKGNKKQTNAKWGRIDCEHHKGVFTFGDGFQVGLKDMNGETKLRAKYFMLRWIGDGRYIAITPELKTGIINEDDEPIVDFKYYGLMVNLGSDRFMAYTSSGKDNFVLIDGKGEELSKDNYSDVVGRQDFSSCFVESNFFDAEAVAENMMSCFGDDNCRGYKGEETVESMMDILGNEAKKHSNNDCLKTNQCPDGKNMQSLVCFDKKIASTSYENFFFYTQSSHSYNYNAKVRAVMTSFGIKDHADSGKEVIKIIGERLGARQYKKYGENSWETPNGCYVGVRQKGEELMLVYAFNKKGFDAISDSQRKRGYE